MSGWAAAIQAIGEVGKGVIQHNQNIENRKERERANERSEYAAKHRYRWAVKDLKAAGLNPLLALGAQAGTPNYQVGMSPSPAAGIDPIGSAAEVYGKTKKATLDGAMVDLTEKQGAAALATAANQQASAKNTEIDSFIKKQTLPATIEQAKTAAQRAQMEQKTMKYEKGLDMFGKGANSVKGLVETFRGYKSVPNNMPNGSILIDSNGQILRER